jgi:hypothetical protein
MPPMPINREHRPNVTGDFRSNAAHRSLGGRPRCSPLPHGFNREEAWEEAEVGIAIPRTAAGTNIGVGIGAATCTFCAFQIFLRNKIFLPLERMTTT